MKQWMMIFLMGAAGFAQALSKLETIQTAKPQRKDFTETLRWFGQVVNRERIEVMALESGRVVSIAVDDGMSVAQGDLLLTLGGPRIDSRRMILRDRVASLQERAAQAGKMVRMKKEAVSRKLAKYQERVVAENEWARLKMELESAEQELQRLETTIQIRAGASGVFSERKTAVGQEVRAGDLLAAILPDSPLQIRATLFPKGGMRLKGQDVTIGRLGKGQIVRVSPQATAAGATVVWIDAADAALRAGQLVSGTGVLAEHRQALALSPDAVVRDDAGQAYLFIKSGDTYQKRAIKTGLASIGWIEITSGLSEVDEVVVQGAYELFHSNFNQIFKVVD